MRVRVSDESMQRIADALDQLGQSDDLKPTKRSIERLAELSHDAVARAFRQDKEEGSKWNLTERFADLVARSDRRSPLQQRLDATRTNLTDARRRIAELEADLEGYAQTIIAQQLELQALTSEDRTVVPLRRESR